MASVEGGVILEADEDVVTIQLENGQTISREVGWDAGGYLVGDKVLVTFEGGFAMRIDLDLRVLGLTEREATSLDAVAAKFEELVARKALTEDQHATVHRVLAKFDSFISLDKASRLVVDKLRRGLVGDFMPITDDDPWAQAARESLATIAHSDAWIAILGARGDGAKPAKKFLAAARTNVLTIGEAAFVAQLREWVARITPRPVVRDETNWNAPAMGDANGDALRNLAWAASTVETEVEPAAIVVGDLAVRCFVKVPGIGALAMKAGNACIWVLSQLPGMKAVAQLSRLGARLKYKKAIELVDRAKGEAAKRAGMEPIDLEELALPTFGLNVGGEARIPLGEHVAVLASDGSDVTLTYWTGTKQLKAAPAAVKKLDEMKDLKVTYKELSEMLPALRHRVERWFVESRSWTLADLRVRYIDHPLAATLARRLIYTGDATVIFLDGFPLGVDGKPVELDDDAKLSLWHPLGRPEREVAAWKTLLAQLEVVQPIEQLERELYLPEQPNARADDRFTDRVLRQATAAALFRDRGWDYRIQGAYDGQGPATKRLLDGFEVDLEIGPADEEMTPSFTNVRVRTGEIRFRRGDDVVRLDEVLGRYFSEALRDVDLFVTKAA
ncbi:MAG TPA: DUF4132 domain-containing protein [Kofleriaceae bacterium]